MRWLVAALAGLVTAVLCAFPVVQSAQAQDEPEIETVTLDGCRGAMASLRPDGSRRDVAVGADDGTNSAGNPFHVGWDDTIAWSGEIGEAPGQLDWSIKVAGVTVQEGREPANRTSWSGNFDVSDVLPFKVTGVYHVEWDLRGEGVNCHGEAWVKLDGSPFLTAPWLAGAGFLVLAVGGAWLARPTRRARHLAPAEEVEA